MCACVCVCVYQGLCGSSLKICTVSVLLDAHRKWASALKDNELMLTYLKGKNGKRFIRQYSENYHLKHTNVNSILGQNAGTGCHSQEGHLT